MTDVCNDLHGYMMRAWFGASGHVEVQSSKLTVVAWNEAGHPGRYEKRIRILY